MSAPEKMVKIHFPLTKENNGYPDIASESVWAMPCGDGSFKIENIPFYVKGVSYGDKVIAYVPNNGVLFYKEHIEYSKHSTLRLFAFYVDQVKIIREHIEKMGCSSELSNLPNFIAIDVPPSVKITEFLAYLADGEKKGEWEYEEGAVWHK